MGWRGTLVLTIIVLVAGGYLWLAGPSQPAVPEDPATLLGEPRLRDPSKFVPLLAFQPAEVDAVRIRHGERELTARRLVEGWDGADSGAIDVFLRTASELGRVMEIPAGEAVLQDYGLDEPRSVVELTLSGKAPLVLQVGKENPAGTGVYVRVNGEGPVILAGALITWELNKLFRRP
jgi:hypothetical protein